MNYHKIESASLSNGLGWRVVLWLSGCSHHCPGCHNPETWDPDSGRKFDDKAKTKLLELLSKPYIKGLTLSGGDPLYIGNVQEVTELCREIKELMPDKDIWIYTGYKYDEVKFLPVMKYADYLVDGEYKKEERDLTLAFRGSRNQNIIDLRAR